MKRFLFFIFFGSMALIHAQTDSLQVNVGLKKIQTICKDTIIFYDVSTYPSDFKISFTFQNQLVEITEKDQDLIQVNYPKSNVILLPLFYDRFGKPDKLDIQFATFPEFLTQKHFKYSEELIFPNLDPKNAIKLSEIPKKSYKGIPFDGLETQGSLIRGISIGNNQDAVLNSVLDLKISGKLTSKVDLNARINDTNIPLQEGGYSQEMKDIDRVYIELVHSKWNVKAGDLMLRDSTHYFLNLTKKVQGVSLQTTTEPLDVFASGALVKGKFATFEFKGQEGNQGPYKLKGSNGENYLFLIEDSERVFIDGILQQKGLIHDYTIDYYTGEILFTTQKPIHDENRIVIEYQYSERNYNRFVTHNYLNYKKEKYQIGFTYYKESDMKNDALQTTLTEEQKELLAHAPEGNALLYVVNAVETPFDPNKILYSKNNISGNDIFEYSPNENVPLYEVGFTYFGANLGDYSVLEYRPNGRIMQYVGENMGDYKAVIPLYAPSALEILSVDTHYQMGEKTDFSCEMAFSNTHKNLFANHQRDFAPAIKVDWNQKLLDKKWKLNAYSKWDYVHQNFSNPEGLHQVEFNRDWNYQGEMGNKSLLISKIAIEEEKNVVGFYQYENLQFQSKYQGNRHLFNLNLNLGQWNLQHNSSLLQSKSALQQTDFVRHHAQLKYEKEKWWSSLEWSKDHNQLDNLDLGNSRTYKSQYEKWTIAKGDTANVYLKTGLQFIQNDTLTVGNINNRSNARNYFLQTQLLKSESSKLSFFVNYRNTDYSYKTDLKSLNAKVNFSHLAFKKVMNWRTEYQLQSGQLAKQDYTYIATEPGQGYYAWIDYNSNDIQEIDEFEIAQFPDQALYLRVSLPNLIYIPTQNVAMEQVLGFDFAQLPGEKKKFLRKWYNQTTLTAQNMRERNENTWNINPFEQEGVTVLNRRWQIQNQLFFNRNNPKYSANYSYSKNSQRMWQSFGGIDQEMQGHQVYFQYMIEGQWQISNTMEYIENKSDNENYLNRNFNLVEQNIKPQIAYFFTKNHWIKVGAKLADKTNQSTEAERLRQSKFLLNYQYTSATDTRFSVDFNYINNDFNANDNSPIAYQMLEGLQAGKNFTWNVMWNKKLNKFLYLNFVYSGRGNENSRIIHNGNVQMRATF